MIPVGEPGDIGDVADDRGGDDRPTPKTSVTVVPEARTAAVSLFLVSRSWASMRRRSARNSPASSRSGQPTAPDG